MFNKTAVLIQAHNNLNYLLALVKINKNTDFFIHFDKKMGFIDFEKLQVDNSNLFFIDSDSRISVFWADFSQIQATLLLIDIAKKKQEYKYYHLMSGECLPLKYFDEIEKEWEMVKGEFIEIKRNKKLEWRIKTKVYHTKKKWMRSIRGKLLNRIYMVLGKFANFSNFSVNEIYYGSQWFSLTDEAINYIILNRNKGYFEQFKNTSCCDEHAFQMLLVKNKNLKIHNSNKRFIRFSPLKSSPDYINISEVRGHRNEYWFARKIDEIEGVKYLNEQL